MISIDGTERFSVTMSRSEWKSIVDASKKSVSFEPHYEEAISNIVAELVAEVLPQDEYVKVWDFVDDIFSDGGEHIQQIMETATPSQIMSWYDNMKECDAEE